MPRTDVLYLYLPEFNELTPRFTPEAIGLYVQLLAACWENKGVATDFQFSSIVTQVDNTLAISGIDAWIENELFERTPDGNLTPTSPAFKQAMKTFDIQKPVPLPVRVEADAPKPAPNIDPWALLEGILFAARIQTPDDMPLFWRRIEHTADAIALVEDTGLPVSRVLEILRNSPAQPDIQRIVDLKPSILKARGQAK